jgi:hypothetical protein
MVTTELILYLLMKMNFNWKMKQLFQVYGIGKKKEYKGNLIILKDK